MKTLIIVSHPKYQESGTQAFLKKSLTSFSDVTWHCLDEEYPDKIIDVEKEKKLLQTHDRIIFQFPMYWYSAPASLKKWEDEVLTRSFTYANEIGALKRKQLGIVTSLGYPAKEFQAGRAEGFSISEIMIPYRALAHRAGMQFMSPLIIDQFAYMTEIQKAELLINYQEYITAPYPFDFTVQQKWIETQLNKLAANISPKQEVTLRLIIEQLEQNQDDLDSLKWQVKLMRQEEEN